MQSVCTAEARFEWAGVQGLCRNDVAAVMASRSQESSIAGGKWRRGRITTKVWSRWVVVRVISQDANAFPGLCVCVGVRAGICGSPETVAERADWRGERRNRREEHERVGAERL